MHLWVNPCLKIARLWRSCDRYLNYLSIWSIHAILCNLYSWIFVVLYKESFVGNCLMHSVLCTIHFIIYTFLYVSFFILLSFKVSKRYHALCITIILYTLHIYTLNHDNYLHLLSIWHFLTFMFDRPIVGYRAAITAKKLFKLDVVNAMH